MLMVGLSAAGAVVVMLSLLARQAWVRWRRVEAQATVTEEQARENAAPLTTAILPGSGDRERGVRDIRPGSRAARHRV